MGMPTLSWAATSQLELSKLFEGFGGKLVVA